MEAILRNPNTADWITVVILASVFFMVIAKHIFYSRFLNFIILPFNNKYLFMYNKKDKLFNWFNIFFTLFQLLNFSLFIYLAGDILFASDEKYDVTRYGGILLGLTLFWGSKTFLQLGNGFIFNSKNTISEIVFKKLSYLNYSGIVMLLANLLLHFVFRGSKTVVIISILVILLINAIGWITILRNHQKFIAGNFMYFILYLCALEIAPIVIIGGYLIERNL